MHNLKGIDVPFPVGKFITVTGVSGSGKSTLVNEIVYKALANRLTGSASSRATTSPAGIECFDKVIDIDQSPIGRAARSNPRPRRSSTTSASSTPRHPTPRCAATSRADSLQRARRPLRDLQGRRDDQDRDALPARRLRPVRDVQGQALQPRDARGALQGKSIADVLEMSIEEALGFFAKIPKIRRRLQTLHDVGLDYVKLGQPATTLSGGKAQRVKLASELAEGRRPAGRSTSSTSRTGLHFADIEKLLEVLQRLVDGGSTVLVIEHNLDVIKQADWIVDLGPEGGEAEEEGHRRGHRRAGRRSRGELVRPLLREALPRAAAVAAA